MAMYVFSENRVSGSLAVKSLWFHYRRYGLDLWSGKIPLATGQKKIRTSSEEYPFPENNYIFQEERDIIISFFFFFKKETIFKIRIFNSWISDALI